MASVQNVIQNCNSVEHNSRCITLDANRSIYPEENADKCISKSKLETINYPDIQQNNLIHNF